MTPRVNLWLFFVAVVGAALVYGLVLDRPDAVIEERIAPASVPPALSPPVAVNGLVRREAVLMGSQFVFVAEGERARAAGAIAAAFERLRELEARISDWRPGSEISRLNDRAGIAPVQVGSDTFALLELSRELHRETGGAFDVTIGAVWDLWPFRDPRAPLPTENRIHESLALVGADRIELDRARSTAYLPVAGMRVNLGAIGKGYAAQAAIEVLRAHGIERAAVSAGGDTYLLGAKSDGPWQVGIEHPRWQGRYIERFAAGDVAVATSGDAERFVERGGKRYGHILDPRTGYPAEGVQSVTIVTADPVRADAYATAVFVMGVARGLAWVAAHPGTEALIVDGEGAVHRSPGWAAMARQAPPSAPEAAPPAAAVAPPAAQATPRERTPAATPRTGMVRVPAGPYLSGDDRRPVPLAYAFFIDRTEVSNRAYQDFLEASAGNPHAYCHPDEPPGKDHTPRYWREFRPPLFRESAAARLAPFDAETFRQPDRPVVGVDGWDAHAYCRWAGKRLPGRAEWEKAARGADGRVWPWGDAWDYRRANTGGEKWGEQDSHIYAAPVDAFPPGASPYGALNMAGNVAEWSADGFVLGGSSNGNPSQVRAAAAVERERGFRNFDIGLRCVADE